MFDQSGAAERSFASKIAFGLAALIGAGTFAVIALSPRATAQTAPFGPDQKAAIEKIVKDYLLANPEVMVEVQSALEAKMEKQQAEKMKAVISENAKDIFRRPDAPVAGNANGDITVVEFFDYNCGYCKRSLSSIAKLVESDKNIRVVFKELPILSKGSEEAARVALAAKLQGKYWEMHQALLNAKGAVNAETALAAAAKLGLDMDRLKKDMESDAVKAEIDKVQALAQKMGVNGTPHFVVGDKSIFGAPEDLYEQIAAHVADLRKTGCSYC